MLASCIFFIIRSTQMIYTQIHINMVAKDVSNVVGEVARNKKYSIFNVFSSKPGSKIKQRSK